LLRDSSAILCCLWSTVSSRRCCSDTSVISSVTGFYLRCLRAGCGDLEHDLQALPIRNRADNGLPDVSMANVSVPWP